MKRYVDTYNEVVGFHRYPNAPAWCDYLSHRHRHVFVIRCRFEVTHNNREIEINDKQLHIEQHLNERYGKQCEFDDMSCEDIAEELMNFFNASQVTVLEDGYGGATLSK